MLDELVVTSSVVDGRTNVTLTFGAGGNLVQTRSNGGHSLVDGNYQLTIDHILISKVGGGPTMLEDFTFGDEAVDDFFVSIPIKTETETLTRVILFHLERHFG